MRQGGPRQRLGRLHEGPRHHDRLLPAGRLEGVRSRRFPGRHARFTEVGPKQVEVAKGRGQQHQTKVKLGPLRRGIGGGETTEGRPDQHVEGSHFVDGLEHDARLTRLIPAVLAHVERVHLPTVRTQPFGLAAVGAAPQAVSEGGAHEKKRGRPVLRLAGQDVRSTLSRPIEEVGHGPRSARVRPDRPCRPWAWHSGRRRPWAWIRH